MGAVTRGATHASHEWPRAGRMRPAGDHGRNACVARVAMGATHALRGWPWMDTQGLRGAGTAQRNGHPGLAQSRDSAAQWTLRACAQQGLRSAMPQQAHHWSDRLLGFRGGFIVERHACTLAYDAIDNGAAQQQHDEWSTPNEHSLGLQRRIEAHELAIAVRHEIEYGIVALTPDQHLAHLPAKIDRKIGIRVGDGLILTDETSKLLSYSFETCLQSLIHELPIGVHRLLRSEGLRSEGQ